MTGIPLKILVPQVFLVPDGILPVGLHGDGWSIAKSLHGQEYHSEHKVQVGFKGEWSLTQ